jgi:hypothetical protein
VVEIEPQNTEKQGSGARMPKCPKKGGTKYNFKSIWLKNDFFQPKISQYDIKKPPAHFFIYRG